MFQKKSVNSWFGDIGWWFAILQYVLSVVFEIYVDIRWWYVINNQTSSTNEPLAKKSRVPGRPPRNQALDEAQEDEKRKLSRVKVRTPRYAVLYKLVIKIVPMTRFS